MTEESDRFCPECNVALDLHPCGMPVEGWECDVANAKATLLEDFGGLVP